MIKYMFRAALVAGAVAVTAPGAQAQTFLSGSNITGCGGGTFLSCAIWNASLSNSNKTLTFSVTNASGGAPANNAGSMFTQILLGNLNNYTIANFSTSGAGSWSAVDGCSGNSNCGFNGFSLNSNVIGANDNAPTAQNGIGAGQTTIFTFTFTGAVSTSDFNDVQVALHDQGGFPACGSSSKAVFNGNTGAPASSASITTCAGTNTVPEPASASLLGLGLSALGGIGGIGRFRRRSAKA